MYKKFNVRVHIERTLIQLKFFVFFENRMGNRKKFSTKKHVKMNNLRTKTQLTVVYLNTNVRFYGY